MGRPTVSQLAAKLLPDCFKPISDALPCTYHLSLQCVQLGRYWNMTRSEYEHLVDLARRNAQE